VQKRSITSSKSCERLLFALVKYLGDCAAIPSYTEFLCGNLQSLLEILVLPSISITQEDIDEFEDDPQAYIRNDLEESDVETRRRQCMKFLQQLSKRFPQQMTGLVSGLVEQLQASYQADRAQNWFNKTTLLNLLITSSIGVYTYTLGATDLLIDQPTLFNYLEQLVIPELQVSPQNKLDDLMLLKATSIKFLYFFRNQIPDAQVTYVANLMADYLKSESLVV
jgi:exportin-2 (importin alpha re-exporter)